jgi:heme A synthase
MRVVLIIVGALLGLWGVQTALSGLYVIFLSRHIGNLFTGLLPLALGAALLIAAWLILRSQLSSNGSPEDAEAERRRVRAGVRILLTIVSLLLGLAGLFASLCGMIFSNSEYGAGAGWFIAIGVVLVAVAILLAVKAARLR